MVKPDNYISHHEVIPHDALFVIESHEDMNQTWENISSSRIWGTLIANSFFKELSEHAQMMDSLIAENTVLTKLTKQKQLIISAHMISKDDFDFLYLIDTRINNENLLELLLPILDAYGITTTGRNFKNYSYSHLSWLEDGNQEHYYLYAKSNLIYCSANEKILQRALSTDSSNSFASYIPVLIQEKKISKSETLRYYINYPEFARYLSKDLDDYAYWLTMLQETLEYTVLNTHMDENMLSLKGLTTVEQTLPSYLQALANSEPMRAQSDALIPERSSLYLSNNFRDFQELYELFMQVYRTEDSVAYLAYQKNVQRIEQVLGIKFKEDLFEWVGNEIALVKLAPYKEGKEEDFLLYIHTKNIQEAKDGMGRIMDKIRKRTPLKFEDVKHLNHDIYMLGVNGLFKPFMGSIVETVNQWYFSYIDNHVVFGNSIHVLMQAIQAYREGRVLKENTVYQNYWKHYDDESSLRLFVQSPYLLSYLYKYGEREAQKSLLENQDLILSFSNIGIQLTANSGTFNTQMLASYDPDFSANNEIDKLEVSATKLDQYYYEDLTFSVPALDSAYLADYGAAAAPSTFVHDGMKYLGGTYTSTGLATGLWRSYYASGQLASVVDYNHDGEVEGKAIFYYDSKNNGNPSVKAALDFEEGKIEGYYIEYYRQGNRKAVLEYDDGRAHGKAFFYYPSGALMIEGKHKKGKKSGRWKYYTAEGERINK